MESAHIQDLNAQLDIAFAALSLAKVTPDHQTVRQKLQIARQYYEAVTDLLFRSTLVELERRQMGERLDELREGLASAAKHLMGADPAPVRLDGPPLSERQT